MQRRQRWVQSIKLLVLLASAVLLLSCRKRPSAANPALNPYFDPRQVPAAQLVECVLQDQDGKPVADAEIDVRTAVLSPENVTTGGVAAGKGTQGTGTVYGDRIGRFGVTLVPPQNWVEIRAIRKPGYDWVIDHAWSLGPPYNRGDNRTFTFAGPVAPFPIYIFDPDRPAIFPLHLRGSPKPPVNPSRGGSDLNADGSTTVNQPVPLLVPSAGPGAPKTREEIAAALDRVRKQPAPKP